MSAPADSAEAPDRAAQMLARLAELDLSAVERAHERFLAAEDGPDAADAARTYQRMARSLRQTLALDAKLKRERDAAARETAVAAARRRVRADQLRTDIVSGVRLMGEPDEREELYEAVEREIEAEALLAGFEDAEFEELIERICARLPLDAERISAVTRVATWRYLNVWPPDDGDPPPSPRWNPPPPPRRESG